MNTRDKILNEALRLMNDQGMDKVSTYDIAKALDIRQSNITYYFAAKSDIVNALCKRMIEDVDSAFAGTVPPEPEKFSFVVFYNMMDSVMKIHQRYKFIMMSYASIICSDKELNNHFITVLEGRKPLFDGLITLLEINGYVRSNEMKGGDYSILFIQNMLAVYWVQESEIYLPGRSLKAKRRHHIKLNLHTFMPYTTEKGKKELETLFSSEWEEKAQKTKGASATKVNISKDE